MSKYTAEQVVTKASQLATDEEYPDKHAADMLRDYAALLREREAAKAGVTAAMVDLAIDVIAEHLTGFGGDLRQGVQSALEAVAPMLASARVPDGYQLVPIEPTREMLEKSVRASMEAESVYDEPRPDGAWEKFGRRINRISHVYKAMLAAAPKRGEG